MCSNDGGRRDVIDTSGAVLLAAAASRGRRSIAEDLTPRFSTVRNWLCRALGRTECLRGTPTVGTNTLLLSSAGSSPSCSLSVGGNRWQTNRWRSGGVDVDVARTGQTRPWRTLDQTVSPCTISEELQVKSDHQRRSRSTRMIRCPRASRHG